MNIEKIMRLADEYARAVWGESDEQHEARAALEAALASDLTEKREPVAWMSRTGHGTYFRESLSPELEALEFGGNKMWTPLYTADQLAGAVLRERERCAKVCEEQGIDTGTENENETDWWLATRGCAAAIRSGE